MKVEIEIQENHSKCLYLVSNRKRIGAYRKACKKKLCEVENGNKQEKARLSKWVDAVQKLLAISVVLYPMAEYVYNAIYQNQCEEFYGIPAKYFSKSINSSIMYIAMLIILLIIPLVGKRVLAKGETSKMDYMLGGLIDMCYGFALGYINLLNLLKICSNNPAVFWKWIYAQLSERIYLFVGIIMGLSIITMMGSSMLLRIKKVKCRSLQIGIYVVVFVSLVTSSYILLNGTRYILDPNPAGKTEYEIAVYMDSEYAVISEYGDKVLVVPLVKNDTEPVLLDAKLYRFIDPSECEFYCINFGHIPTVDKRDTLDNSPS